MEISNKKMTIHENIVIVRESNQGPYTREITANNHVLIADEPTQYGGNDLGPSPYELLLASLGSCTSLALRMYANYKKIPLEKATVKLKHYKIHAEDCKNCSDKNSMLDRIDVQIELQGNLSLEQRTKLLEIAKHCPVHRTLTSQILINTELTE
jgi:putative redox protein